MRIIRSDEPLSQEKLLECTLYVRKDLVVANASEPYYAYVGECSCLPISDLIYPEDGEILKQEVKHFTQTVELVTGITNRREGFRSAYLRMEESDQTENGEPLYKVTIFDIRDMENRNTKTELLIAKYRHFLGLNNFYYFEYTRDTHWFAVYKYVSERSMQIFDDTMEEFLKAQKKNANQDLEHSEQFAAYSAYLQNSRSFFEMEFSEKKQEELYTYRVKGGPLYKNQNLVAGIFILNQMADKEKFYLTPAARDAGTGLLNKKAVTEYVMEKLQAKDEKIRWFLMIDIDDFKAINDTYGHLFGDEVIRKVADVLQVDIGYRGTAGRFGGDEFFILLEKVPTREDLKILIKTVTKKLTYAFDPKCKLTLSIGVSQYPTDGTEYDELVGKADKALYIAKAKGKNRHVIYEEALHGAFEKNNMSLQVSAYTISKEKRREILINLLSNIYTLGTSYLIDRKEVQNQIRQLFDLDGFSVYTNYGKECLCRSGNYAKAEENAGSLLTDEQYMTLFGTEDMLIESNIIRLKVENPKAYETVVRQELGAFIQCVARRDGMPYALISFDVFNRNRKWSDTDIELLGIVGCCLGKMLCERDCN